MFPSTMPAPTSRRSQRESLDGSLVPTGMKAGVSTCPRGVLRTPRASPTGETSMETGRLPPPSAVEKEHRVAERVEAVAPYCGPVRLSDQILAPEAHHHRRQERGAAGGSSSATCLRTASGSRDTRRAPTPLPPRRSRPTSRACGRRWFRRRPARPSTIRLPPARCRFGVHPVLLELGSHGHERPYPDVQRDPGDPRSGPLRPSRTSL